MPITFEKHKCKSNVLGIINLDRPKALNSLNLEMCRKMADTLKEWSQDDQIACILIQGNGDKGFCAGGDVKLVREAIEKSKTDVKEFQYVLDFFCEEYRNDYQLTLINKPIICWATGITMGGGMGLMQGASYRVVSETSTLAMPEISIGLYPDVGASYFLSRLPKGVGLFLALTGARFGPHDAIDLELADYYIKSSSKENIIQELLNLQWSKDIGENHKFVNEVLLKNKYPMRLRSTISSHLQGLIKLESCKNAKEAFDFLENLSQKSPWVAESFENLKKGSPLSACIIFEYLKRAREMSRKDVFILDFNLSIQFSLGHDFSEGVRAVLIDKGTAAHWEFPSLLDVPTEVVQNYFEDPWKNDTLTSKLIGSQNPFLKLIDSL